MTEPVEAKTAEEFEKELNTGETAYVEMNIYHKWREGWGRERLLAVRRENSARLRMLEAANVRIESRLLALKSHLYLSDTEIIEQAILKDIYSAMLAARAERKA